MFIQCCIVLFAGWDYDFGSDLNGHVGANADGFCKCTFVVTVVRYDGYGFE